MAFLGKRETQQYYSGTADPYWGSTAMIYIPQHNPYYTPYRPPDWRCRYCKSLNPGERYHCTQCNAGKE